MRIIIFFLFILQILVGGVAQAKDNFLEVIVADPFLNMRTGPGSNYPIFHIVERGEKIKVLKRKTDWFKIRNRKGKEGWTHRNELSQTLTLDGKRTTFKDITIEDFKKRGWELGLLSGDFEGAASITLYGSHYFTQTLSTEISATHAIGNFSSSVLANIKLAAHPFPEWRASPFFALGIGIIKTTPNATLVKAIDRTDPMASVTIGANIYLKKKYMLRLEYNNYKVFTSRNNNEEIGEWKAGFAAFF